MKIEKQNEYFLDGYLQFLFFQRSLMEKQLKEDFKFIVDVSDWSIVSVCSNLSSSVGIILQESVYTKPLVDVVTTSSNVLDVDDVIVMPPLDPSCLCKPLDILDDVLSVVSPTYCYVDLSDICDVLASVSVLIDDCVDLTDVTLMIPSLPSTSSSYVVDVQVDDLIIAYDDVAGDKLSIGLKCACMKFFKSVGFSSVDVVVDKVDSVVDFSDVDCVYPVWLFDVLHVVDGLCCAKVFSDYQWVFDDGG